MGGAEHPLITATRMAQSSHITITDQFCGAGGSSQGVRNYARRAGLGTGVEIKLALNHWKLAIETHNTNFPDTLHDCTDIQACDPRNYPSTTMLVTSPECFPAGTLVLCERGLIPIEEVTTNDRVFTHKNKWRKVTAVMNRIADTVIVKGQGHPGLECTANHPFYVRRQTRVKEGRYGTEIGGRSFRKLDPPQWIAAKDLCSDALRWATPTMATPRRPKHRVEDMAHISIDGLIPGWVFDMPKAYLQAFVDQFMTFQNTSQDAFKYRTSSKRTAFNLRLLLVGLGYDGNISLLEIKSNHAQLRESYTVEFIREKKISNFIRDEAHAWSLVKSIIPGRKKVKVYCLSVEEDESFVADGIVVHNCVNHSIAKGRKQVKAQLDAFACGKQDPAAERSRATMWDVVRFAEVHQYRIIITENVVDARAWLLWDSWLRAMHTLGYRHQCVFFNSMFAWPTPQSRDRMYVVFWRKGQKKPDLDIRPWAPCPRCGNVQAVQRFKPGASVRAKYGTQYIYSCPRCAAQVTPFYYAAINAIDWSVPAQRIGDRKRPLEPRTLQRIAYGLKKYGNRPLALSTLHGERLACRVKDATEAPLFTQTGNSASALAAPFLNMPFTISLNYPEQVPGPVDGPLRTITGSRPEALVMPSAMLDAARIDAPATAFLATLRGTGRTALQGTASGLDEPVGTISAGGMHHALITGKAAAFLQSYYGSGHNQCGMDEAMGALSTRDRHALLVGQAPRVEDLHFRMLKVHELKAGQAFDTDYVIHGTQRDQVKQIGNAVTPPVMEVLAERCIQSLM